MAGKGRRRWQRAETYGARLFGTERIPNNGFGQPDYIIGDIPHRDAVAVQVKVRADLPKWLLEYIEQAELDARNMKKPAIPMVQISLQQGTGHPNQHFAFIRLEDLEQIIQKDFP